eukprot:TRINITY_DN4278_c0_g1_i1.p1 TRINITY_DN4278_c0_g1~~TRINITY_DN4278_c0_g1_i1.p1  ORF type:complete len:350 (-),score=73.32 TRINITY_DN4278_c0_g1_i1:149-1132(-)
MAALSACLFTGIQTLGSQSRFQRAIQSFVDIHPAQPGKCTAGVPSPRAHCPHSAQAALPRQHPQNSFVNERQRNLSPVLSWRHSFGCEPHQDFVANSYISSSSRLDALNKEQKPKKNGESRRSNPAASAPRAAKRKAPPVVPLVLGPSGPTDLMSAFFRNRIIFIGSAINSQMAQRVVSQLITLEAMDDKEDIKIYINCPGGSTYSVMAIYDAMAWVKPDISTVAFGLTASQGALILAAGTKGKRFAMPNARIMIHQPQGGCGGTSEDVRRQVNEVMASRDKIDKMFSAFTGQPVELVQKYTERDRFFSAAEAMEFGLIDGMLETEY